MQVKILTISFLLHKTLAMAREGNLDVVIDDISFIILRNTRNLPNHYVFGVLMKERGEIVPATLAIRCGYELLLKTALNLL